MFLRNVNIKGAALGDLIPPVELPPDVLPDWLTGFPVAGNDYLEVVIGSSSRETKVSF